MKPETVIQVHELTKVYKLYNAPIDRLKEAMNPFSKRKYHKDFYALNGVSFDIKKGECVGVLGKNGAGKSTLLKILTGVLTQSSGSVEVKGKISALLELGAGFNPEYTGMENIYFQGNVMGYSNEEIAQKIPAILEFADIGEFVGQPVKSYSSGMFARLAFSVAINVEPDILIVDEALSVGDAMFQNKCIRKMTEIMENGATILFVSHDTQAINKFCTRAIWLRDGKKYMDGKTQDVTNAYMSFSSYGLETETLYVECNNTSNSLQSFAIDYSGTAQPDNCELFKFGEYDNIEVKSKFGTGDVEFLKAGFYDIGNRKISVLKHEDTVYFRCLARVLTRDIYDIAGGINFKDRLNNYLFTINSYMYKNPLQSAKKGDLFYYEFKFRVPKVNPTDYVVDITLAEGTQQEHSQLCWANSVLSVSIVSNDFIECGASYTIPPGDVIVSYRFLSESL